MAAPQPKFERRAALLAAVTLAGCASGESFTARVPRINVATVIPPSPAKLYRSYGARADRLQGGPVLS